MVVNTMFITPVVSKIVKPNMIRGTMNELVKVKPLKMSLHPEYDIIAVSTYIAYFTAQYWTGEQRRDVELFGILLGLLWNFTTNHDPTVYIYLWLIGGLSHFVSRSFLAGGNKEEANRFHVGVQMGGYMSFLLMIFDLLDVLFGY